MSPSKGSKNYCSGLSIRHPFRIRCPNIDKNNLLTIYTKIYRWRLTAIWGILFVLISTTVLIVCCLLQRPTIFADTVLSSGRIYQQGIMVSQPNKSLQSYILLHTKHRVSSHKSI